MASSTRNSDGRDAEIRLWREDEWWVAEDVATGVTTQGSSRAAALSNLDDALELHDGGGRTPTNQELRDAGIEPADNETGDEDTPDVLD